MSNLKNRLCKRKLDLNNKEDYKRQPVKSKTLMWYGTCLECCKINNEPLHQVNKVICIECGKKIVIADISDDVSIIDKSNCLSNSEASIKKASKCRLCLNVIRTEVIPIWGVDSNYSEMILSCCSINVSKDDKLSDDMCKECVALLDSAYKFKEQCLKNNATLNEMKDAIKKEENIFCNNEYEDLSQDVFQDFGINYDEDDITIYENNETHQNDQYICEKCPMVCDTEKQFNIHRDSHCMTRSTEENDIPKIFCQVDDCNKEFVKFKDREVHQSTRHKNSNVYNYICPYCAQLLKRLRSYNYHAYFLHFGDEVICNACGKLMNRFQLKIHNKKVHMKETVACLECGLNINKYSFKRHMKQMHDEKNKLNCRFCNKKFSNKWNLQTHIRTHTGEMPYSCPDCELNFSHRVSMKNHRLYVHNVDMFEKNVEKRKCTGKKATKTKVINNPD